MTHREVIHAPNMAVTVYRTFQVLKHDRAGNLRQVLDQTWPIMVVTPAFPNGRVVPGDKFKSVIFSLQ